MIELFAFIAVILAAAGHVPYFVATWKGQVQPHPYTWFIGSVTSGIVVAGLLAKGGGFATLPVLVTALFTFAIFWLSLARGIDAIKLVDALPLICALFGIVLWILLKDPTITVAIAVMIDLISFAPTVRKTWVNPRSEATLLYGTNIFRHLLIIASLSSFNFVTLAHSVAMLATNSFMYSLITVRRRYAPVTAQLASTSETKPNAESVPLLQR